MVSINDLRKKSLYTILLGSHPGIIQSILDYDYLTDKKAPSITAIIAKGRKLERYFWGETEVTIPVLGSLEELSIKQLKEVELLINVQSARRVLNSTIEAVEKLPSLKVLTIFAEQTPEQHSKQLHLLAHKKNILIVGPSSVGLLLPGYIKLGAIGGTQHKQMVDANILTSGNTAVVSTSGGMVNELIHAVTRSGRKVSFAVAVGGDLYPITTPAEAILLAERDKQTEDIVYFGELGGRDEYLIAELIKQKKITKKIIAYIAGTAAELFETPPQFGHAKALANTDSETAKAKRDALQAVGVIVCKTFGELDKYLNKVEVKESVDVKLSNKTIGGRRRALFTSHLSGERNGEAYLLGSELIGTVSDNSVASLVLSMLLGNTVQSKRAIDFTDLVIRLLSDHGPYVSGAMNTIVAARAGKDLVSSLASGLLTIGPRFGGAINASAGNWLKGVSEEISSKQFVSDFSQNDGIIPGIGHKKYSLDLPDPRIIALLGFANNKNNDRYLKFARAIETQTTAKKANLILNVDGAIGAIMLDILESELSLNYRELKQLVDIEFFNALFVVSRSIGLTAHYLDQRRHDEGLFRLGEDDVRYLG